MSVLTGNQFVYCDSQKCLGCRNCEIACALAHLETDLTTATRLNLPLMPRNSVVTKEGLVRSNQCRHCEDAPCIKACPIGIISQEKDMVKINEEKCIGCTACVRACPYDAIAMLKKPKVEGKRQRAIALKCDLCSNQKDEKGQYSCACIESCPTKALMLLEHNPDPTKKPFQKDSQFFNTFRRDNYDQAK